MGEDRRAPLDLEGLGRHLSRRLRLVRRWHWHRLRARQGADAHVDLLPLVVRVHRARTEIGSLLAQLRLTNLRGNVSQLGIGSATPVLATLSVNGVPSSIIGNINPNTNPLSVGVPVRGLLSTLAGGGLRCTGSILPTTISFSNLLAAGTRFASTRLTEGFPTAFEKKLPGADTGIRVIARYTGLPAGARLFVPDAVAGSDAV